MKKQISKIIFLALILTLVIFAFASCGDKKDPTPAAMPTLSYDETGISISSELENVSFVYKLDNGSWIPVTGGKVAISDLASSIGQHTISVKVDAEGSLVAELTYQVNQVSLSDLTLTGSTVSFTSSGMKISCKKDAGEYQVLTSNSFAVTEPGVYTVKVEGGVDIANKIYYAGTAVEKNITVEATALRQVTIRVDGQNLVWDSVEGATGYQAKIGDGEFVDATSVPLATTIGTYTVVVKAVGDPLHTASEATFTYEVKAVSLSDPQVQENKITWIACGIEAIKVDSGEFAAPEKSGEYVMSLPGTLTIKVSGGWDEEAKVLYVGSDIEKTGTVELKGLATPVLTPNINTGKISVETVEHATSYEFKVDGVVTSATNNTVDLPNAVGRHTITVKAIGDGISYGVSKEATFAYEIKAVTLDIVKSTYEVSWTATALKVQLKTNGAYEDTTLSSFYTNESMTVSIQAIGGWDASNNIYYVGQVEKTAVFEFSSKTIIEDANEYEVNAELNENWTLSVYDNAWKDTTATLVLANSFSEAMGNAMKLNCWNNGNAFRYSTKISPMPFNVVSFDVKGNGISNVKIQFMVTGDAKYPGTDISLKGIYATYTLTACEDSWQNARITMSDENWAVNFGGNTYTIPQLVAAVKTAYKLDLDFEKVAQFFDTFNIIIQGNTSNGASANVLFDNIALEKAEDTASTLQQYLLNVAQKYTAEKNETVFLLNLTGANSCTLSTLNLENNINYPFNFVQVGSTFVLNIPGSATSPLTITLGISGNGSTLKVLQVTGEMAATYAPMLQDLVFNSVYSVENFDLYTETGVGIDATNTDPTKIKGLRADYFAEYYSGNASDESPLSGKNWKLISAASADTYLTLSDTGMNESKAMKLRSFSGGNTKFTTLANVAAKISNNAVSDWATSFGKGSALSFFAKGSDVRDVTIKVYPIYTASLQGNAINELTGTDVVIKKGSDWTRYQIAVDATKELYGYVILTRADSAYSKDAWILIDNIELFTANPYAEFVDPAIDLSEYSNVNVSEDFSGYAPASGGAVQPNSEFSKSGSAGFYVRNDADSGYGDSKYMTFQYVNSSTLLTNTLIYTLKQEGIANYVSFAIANDRNGNAVQAEIVVKVYDVKGKVAFEDSFTIEKGAAWELKEFKFDDTAVSKISIQVNAATKSGGDGYMKFDNIVIKENIPVANVSEDFSGYNPSSGGAVQPNSEFSKSGTAGFYVRNDAGSGYDDSKYMTFQYVNSSTLLTNTLIYTLKENSLANYVSFAIANDRNGNAVQAEIVVKVYDSRDNVAFEDSFTIEKGATWALKEFNFDATVVSKISIQVNASVKSSGDGYMKFDNIVINKNVPNADLHLTFDDGTSGSTYNSAKWTQSLANQMNCRTDGNGDKVVNFAVNAGDRTFTYADGSTLGLANHMSFRVGNYNTANTIYVKLYLTTAEGEKIYIVGSETEYVQVASTGTGSSNKLFAPMEFDFDEAEIVSFTFVGKVMESANAYLYIDDIVLNYKES